MLALEIKGTDSPQNKAKRDALSEWGKAINGTGGFGQWAWDVAFKPLVEFCRNPVSSAMPKWRRSVMLAGAWAQWMTSVALGKLPGA